MSKVKRVRAGHYQIVDGEDTYDIIQGTRWYHVLGCGPTGHWGVFKNKRAQSNRRTKRQAVKLALAIIAEQKEKNA